MKSKKELIAVEMKVFEERLDTLINKIKLMSESSFEDHLMIISDYTLLMNDFYAILYFINDNHKKYQSYKRNFYTALNEEFNQIIRDFSLYLDTKDSHTSKNNITLAIKKSDRKTKAAQIFHKSYLEMIKYSNNSSYINYYTAQKHFNKVKRYLEILSGYEYTTKKLNTLTMYIDDGLNQIEDYIYTHMDKSQQEKKFSKSKFIKNAIIAIEKNIETKITSIDEKFSNYFTSKDVIYYTKQRMNYITQLLQRDFTFEKYKNLLESVSEAYNIIDILIDNIDFSVTDNLRIVLIEMSSAIKNYVTDHVKKKDTIYINQSNLKLCSNITNIFLNLIKKGYFTCISQVNDTIAENFREILLVFNKKKHIIHINNLFFNPIAYNSKLFKKKILHRINEFKDYESLDLTTRVKNCKLLYKQIENFVENMKDYYVDNLGENCDLIVFIKDIKKLLLSCQYINHTLKNTTSEAIILKKTIDLLNADKILIEAESMNNDLYH